MALATAALKSSIKNALVAQQSQQNPETAADAIAEAIANAMEAFVKSGTVNFTAGSVHGTTMVQGTPTPLSAGSAENGQIS